MERAQRIQLAGLTCLLAAFTVPGHAAEPLHRVAAPSRQLQPASRTRMDPNLQAFRLELAAYRQDLAAVERRVRRMKARQQRLRDLASKLSGVADDGQMWESKLQSALQKQQQISQMMSNILKTMNDTAKSVINNMQGSEKKGPHYASPAHRGVTRTGVRPPHTR